MVLALACASPAQQVSVTVRSPAPLTAGAIYGGQVYNTVLPSGPQNYAGGVHASSPIPNGSIVGANAGMWWTLSTPNTLVTPSYFMSVGFYGLANSPTGPASSSIGPNDLIFEFTASAPRDATLTIDLTADITSATHFPTFEVDVGDDGSPEAWFGDGVTTVSVQLGPQPVPIRVRTDFAVGSPNPAGQVFGSMHGSVEMRLTPDNHVNIQQVVPTCGYGQLECRDALAHDGIEFRDVGAGPLKVLVLGMQPMPQVFPNSYTTCLLWPAPDVLIGPIGTFDLPIPASVRPFTFYAQSVYARSLFGVLDVTASQAYRIYAH